MNPSRPWLPRAALVAMTWAAYFPVWQNGFVNFDDEPHITDNAHVGAGLTASSVRWALFNSEPPYRAPATWLTFQLDSEVSARLRPDAPAPLPEVVHAQNLIWHSVNVLLLFGLCLRLPGGTAARAFLVAALFAVHPMHVESVAWAFERKDVLMCAFGLIAVRAYLRFAETRRLRFYAAALGAMALSLASKPMLITLPCVLLLLDYWPLRRTRFGLLDPGAPPPVPFARLLLEKVPFFVLALAVALETGQTQSGVSFSSITFADRVMNVLSGYGWYVSTTFCPWPLAALYPHPRGEWSGTAALTGAAILASVTALALRRARARPWLAVGWFWFVGTLFPVTGFEQVGQQAWADRFSYWPHIGLFVALVWAVAEIGARARVPLPVARTAWVCALGAASALTWVQVGYWRDGVALWEHTVAVTNDNQPARERLSAAYRKQGRTEEADAQMSAAAELARARVLRQVTRDKR